MSCLALDDMIYATSEFMPAHPQCRCAIIPLLRGRPVPQWETGLDWFGRQDAATQRAMLGPGRYDAWKDGRFGLAQLATVRPNVTWGPNVGMTSLKALLAGDGIPGGVTGWTAEELQRQFEARSPKVLGYSFFRAEEGQRLTVAQARLLGESTDGWLRHERIFRDDYLARFELVDDIEWTIGLWGGPEPSFVARVTGPQARVIQMGQAWGADFNQEAMALLLPAEGAEGGYLSWDLGRAVDDDALQRLLGGVNDVNVELAGQVSEQYGLEDFFVGLTVKESRFLEFWYGSELAGEAGQHLIEEAMRRADLRGTFEQFSGYEFLLLFQGGDY